jgi:hypothetical protein
MMVFGGVEEVGESCHPVCRDSIQRRRCRGLRSQARWVAGCGVSIRSLGGGRDDCSADDLAVYFFVLRGFDIGFVVVDLIVDGTAYDEICGVHGVVRIGAAGVSLSVGVEGKVIALMLVLCVLGAVGLGVFQGGVSLDLVGEGWKGREEGDG